MLIQKQYSHKKGKEFIEANHPKELAEVNAAIAAIDAVACLRKISREKTMLNYLLFSPVALNQAIKNYLYPLAWAKRKADGKYEQPTIDFAENRFRECDGVKNRVGLEVQFGKYAFMGYDIFSKAIIFRNKGATDCLIEVVAMASLVNEMSTGVSEFEQILIDFEYRGEADIDIPTIVLGLALTDAEAHACEDKRRRFRENPQALIKSGEVDLNKDTTAPGPK